jgi:SAM-dependent methyltransferase
LLGVVLVEDQIALTARASIKNKWACWRSIYPYTWAVWQKSSYQHFAEYVNALEYSTVLDLGTGIGACIPLLRLKPSSRIIFTDPDSIALALAQAVPNASSQQFTFDVLDAKSAIEKYSTATHVSLLHVYSVLPDPLIFLEQCHRQVPQVLTPDEN